MDQQPERPHYARAPDLTPEEIAARAAAIRGGWSEKTELKRRTGSAEGRPVIAEPDLPAAGDDEE